MEKKKGMRIPFIAYRNFGGERVTVKIWRRRFPSSEADHDPAKRTHYNIIA
jgi:hypothetical protein